MNIELSEQLSDRDAVLAFCGCLSGIGPCHAYHIRSIVEQMRAERPLNKSDVLQLVKDTSNPECVAPITIEDGDGELFALHGSYGPVAVTLRRSPAGRLVLSLTAEDGRDLSSTAFFLRGDDPVWSHGANTSVSLKALRG